jgi:hypothetical protein
MLQTIDRDAVPAWLRWALVLAGFFVCLAFSAWQPTLANATVSYSDTEFAPGDWTAQVFYTSGNGGSGSATQQPGGGNPGACRRVTHNIATRTAKVAVLHERAGATYDPQTQGAIAEIDFAFDAKTIQDPGYGGQSATLGIKQNGIVYCGPYFSNGSEVWQGTVRSNLTANDFILFDGTLSHPDFSSSGGAIQFGLVTSNHNPPDGIIGGSITIVEYDNWSMTIDQVPTAVTDGATPMVRSHSAMPNPFGNDTRIRFTLEETASVRVVVYDVQGRMVRRVGNSRFEAGPQSVLWDGRDSEGREAVSGVYFYRIHADRWVASGRVTLIR